MFLKKRIKRSFATLLRVQDKTIRGIVSVLYFFDSFLLCSVRGKWCGK